MFRMRISTQLSLLIVGGVAFLGIVATAGMWGVKRGTDSLNAVYVERLEPIVQLSYIEGRMFRNRVLVAQAASDPTPERVADTVQAVEANIAAIGKTWEAFVASHQAPEEIGLSKKYADARGQFVKQGLRPTLEALKAGDKDKAYELVQTALPKLHEPASRHLEALVELQKTVAKQEYEAARTREQRFLWGLSAAAALSLLIALGVGWSINRRITRALGAEPDDLRQVVDAVAKGDLTTAIHLREGDQGSVMSSLQTMSGHLGQSVGTVRRSADQLATAAAQIAQGNLDLSSRTEQQASALQQTASSMEQLGSTVRQNADNAKQANQLAMSASSVAVQGGDVVSQVVETMKGINDSSKKIADIISVIDGIAFQTNILALNAAVEAARAGEQGRGFAVVAGEVRSLAQRSAEAAREIKQLITASVERVGQGSALVDRAGHTMEEIVASIKRVTDIMGEISAASAEQSSGVAQVGQAITQMDHATQQNAALVEQSAAAADSLKLQAQQLVQAVASFRLADQAGSLELFAPDSGKNMRAPPRGAQRLTPVTKPTTGKAAVPASAQAAAPANKAQPAVAAAPLAAPVAAGVVATAAVAVAAGSDDDWATF